VDWKAQTLPITALLSPFCVASAVLQLKRKQVFSGSSLFMSLLFQQCNYVLLQDFSCSNKKTVCSLYISTFSGLISR